MGFGGQVILERPEVPLSIERGSGGCHPGPGHREWGPSERSPTSQGGAMEGAAVGTCGGEEAGTTGFQLLRMSQDGPEHLLTPPAGLPAKPLGSGVSPPRSGLCLQAEAQGAPGRWQSLLSSPLPDLPTCCPHPHPTPHTPHSEPGTRAASLAAGALAPSVLRCDPPGTARSQRRMDRWVGRSPSTLAPHRGAAEPCLWWCGAEAPAPSWPSSRVIPGFSRPPAPLAYGHQPLQSQQQNRCFSQCRCL